MKRMIFIETVSSLKNKSLHIRLDGTVGIISTKKPSVAVRLMQSFRSVIAFIFAPIP